MAIGKIENPLQPIRPAAGAATTVIETLSQEYKTIVGTLYCSAESRWNLSGLFRLADFDPEKGYKYRLVGSGNFYVFPQVKDGTYLVGRKHYPIPVIEKQLKGQFILCNSISEDHFDTKKWTEPDYFKDLRKSMAISAMDRLEFLAYLIFRGTGNNFSKNEGFEKIASEGYEKQDGSTNGYPIYHMTFDLKEAADANFKVTKNDLKTAIDDLRTKIATNKEEIDTADAQIKKKILIKNIELTEDNKGYLKTAVMREEMFKLLEKIELNPHKYAIAKNNVANFRYPVFSRDLIILANTKINHNWRYALRFGSDQDSGDFFADVRAAGVKVIESPTFPEDQLLIFHRDAIQLVVNSRYTDVWAAYYDDPRITNINNSVAVFMGIIDELPCVTLKFKN